MTKRGSYGYSKNNNVWVLFSNGIYMQVIGNGMRRLYQEGTSVDVLVRFSEYNLNMQLKWV